MIEITPLRLYKIGIFCFTVYALTQIWSLLLNWDTTNIPSRIGTAAMIFFNIGIAMVFNYLRKNDPSNIQTQTEQVEKSEIDSIVEVVGNGTRTARKGK